MYDSFAHVETNGLPLLSISAATKHASWSSLVGIVTAIIGNVLISFALNTQRYAHIRIDREFQDGQEKTKSKKHLPKSIRGYGATVQQEQAAEERERLNANAPGPGNEDDNTNAFGLSARRRKSVDSDATVKPHEKDGQGQQKRKSYLKSPIWWVGIVLMAIGETGNFLAYGFAPASIVSPLGVVALIVNCLIAPLMLKERFRKRDFWGVLIAIGGAVTVVLSAKTNEEKLGPDDLWESIKAWEFLVYIGITCVLIVILMVASPRYGKRTILIDLGLVGLFGGYTALSTKGVASMLSGSLWSALTFPITYGLIAVLVVSAIMQIRYINRALSNFDSTSVIPTQFVFFTLSVIIGSAVLYRDFKKTDPDHVIKFAIGCLLTFSGVWLITSGRKNNDGDEDEGTQDETIQLIDEEAEMQEENAPMKQEQSLRLDTDVQRPLLLKSHSVDDATNVAPPTSASIPSLSFTPYDENLDPNPWVSSSEHLDETGRPRTPSNPRQLSDPEGTPFFTPGSAPDTARRSRAGILGRAESSPADPQTPTRGNRAPSPPTADSTDLPAGEVLQTPQSTLFRSARGSISRLLPGPFLGPLSSSSLNTVVAESLLKGEGSPQGPIRSRSYRRNRPLASRAERNRRRSATNLSGADAGDLESGLMTPNALSRWGTDDSTQVNTEQRTTERVDGDQGESSTRSRGDSFMRSLRPSITKLVSSMRDKSGKERETDEH